MSTPKPSARAATSPDSAVPRHEFFELSAANGAIAGRACEHQERQSDLEAEGRRTIERQAEAERPARRSFAAQKHLGRRADGRSARQR